METKELIRLLLLITLGLVNSGCCEYFEGAHGGGYGSAANGLTGGGLGPLPPHLYSSGYGNNNGGALHHHQLPRLPVNLPPARRVQQLPLFQYQQQQPSPFGPYPHAISPSGPPPPPPHPPHHGHAVLPARRVITAQVPVSPVFNVEVMRPMAQLEEKKSVTLYIVPQNSLRAVPHAYMKGPVDESLIASAFAAKYQTLPVLSDITSVPDHIPAVEVPLAKPIVITSAHLNVIAPAGFTVLFKGPLGQPLTYPIATAALLAPVPVGTIISPETPVVLTTIYAVPILPAVPGSIKILAEVSRPATSNGPAKVRPIGHLQSRYPVAEYLPAVSPSPYPHPPQNQQQQYPVEYSGLPVLPPNGYGHGNLIPVEQFRGYRSGGYLEGRGGYGSFGRGLKQQSLDVDYGVPPGPAPEVEFVHASPSPSSSTAVTVAPKINRLEKIVVTTARPYVGSTIRPSYGREALSLSHLKEAALKRRIIELQHELRELQVKS